MNTIHVNSETLRLLFTANHPTSVPHRELEIHGHFRPYTHHNTIYSTNYTMNNPNNPWTVMDCPNGFLKPPHLGFKIWDRSNGRSRPQTNRNINKTLKQSVNSSRIKPLPHGFCRNSLKPKPTRRPCLVEQPSFLSRRIPTVRSPVIVERSHTLSH